MNAIALPGVLAGGDERALRIVPFIATMMFLFAAWQFARRTVDAECACWLVGILAGAHPFVMYSGQLLSDLPSGACLLGALAILIPELRRDDGPRYRLVAVAPLLAASFYIRYGSCVTIALIGAAAIAIGCRGIARRPLPVIATCLVFGTLLVPHIADSIRQTGSPLGILHESASVPQKIPAGLADYFLTNPFVRYGVLVAPLIVVGALSLGRDRVLTVLQIVAAGQILVLGVTTGAHTRFIYFAVVMLLVVGIATTRRAIMRAPYRTRIALAAAAAGLVVSAWVVAIVVGVVMRERRVDYTVATRLAANAIRGDAHGEPCAASASATTQLEWYSRCPVVTRRSGRLPADRRAYAVVTDGSAPPGATIFYAPGQVQVVRVACPGACR